MTNVDVAHVWPVPYVTFDTNCLNSRGLIPEMTQLQTWADEGLLSLPISETLHIELPDGPGRMRDKASEFIIVGGEDLNVEEQRLLVKLKQIIFPKESTLTSQQEKDVRHLFDHQKYKNSQWTFFVTNDRHFLDHADELLQLGLRVGTPRTCMAWLGPILQEIERTRMSCAEEISHRQIAHSSPTSGIHHLSQKYSCPPYSVRASATPAGENIWAPEAVVEWFDGPQFHIQELFANHDLTFPDPEKAIHSAALLARNWIENRKGR